MNTLNGLELPFDFKKMKKEADLIYEGGPILSLYVSDGDYYLYCWTDCDDVFNRWMIFRVTYGQLREYIDGKISLLKVLMDNPDGFVRFADYDGKKVFPTQIIAISTANISPDYLPEKDSFFNFGISDEIRRALLPKNYNVVIPENEQNLFLSLMAKLGWKSSAAVF